MIESGTEKVPELERAERAEGHHDEIIELFTRCNGNLVRVHEEIVAGGLDLSYPALTAYCRRHGIGHEQKVPAGQYHFAPGKEMQHDTSPHAAHIAGRLRSAQIAGLVLAHSELSFMQLYPSFTRFECKVFLDDALDYIGGICETCMVDNTSVIVLRGTGKEMVPSPEMEAFAEQRGFVFKAHEKGDADRSARVEVFFRYVQGNFLAGRTFESWEHANREAIAWCDRINARFSRKLHASRRDLFAAERHHLKPLPIWRPDVYRLYHPTVDLESYVSVRGTRYSVPVKPTNLIGRTLEVRETKSKLLLFDGPRLVATHERMLDPPRRVRLPEHQMDRRRAARSERFSRERQKLLEDLPEFASYLAQLERRSPRGRSLEAFRRVRRMLREYPKAPFLAALREAAQYGLYDLERVERMILKKIQGDFFPHFLETSSDLEDHDPEDGDE